VVRGGLLLDPKEAVTGGVLEAGNRQVQVLGTVLARGLLQVVPWRQADGAGRNVAHEGAKQRQRGCVPKLGSSEASFSRG